ncbi:MAG: transcriptional repressor [Flavobacteriales bacterium]|nr:transcriptional repressor [Flavobacteriales bacterium]
MEAPLILSNHDLRNTSARLAVLGIFQKYTYALSHSNIEKELQKDFDRVTIYRTIHSFLDKGIVHKVMDDSESAKYALCVDECSSDHHHDNHVHFKCSKCGNSECLNNIQIPLTNLPSGYIATESNLLIEGVCKACS